MRWRMRFSKASCSPACSYGVGRWRMADAIVLLSGGVDSMATADVVARLDHKVRGLFVDYGQPAAKREREAAIAIASALRIPLRICEAAGLRPPDPLEMPGRNGLLLHIALHLATPSSGLIRLGIHTGSQYPDCT